MGVVVAALQPALNREVAVKIIPRQAGQSQAEQRFLREVKVCTQLSHPHVVKLLDAGETDQWLYFTMELIQGRSLDRVIAGSGALAPEVLLDVMEHLADALDFVHSKGIVHRDVKPGNVMLAAGVAKLMDFGLARGIASTLLTEPNVRVGSPRYLSPETVARGEATQRSDLYSLGVTFHELATGVSLYHGLDFSALMAAILQKPAPPPSRSVIGFPGSMDDIIAGLMTKDPAARTPSAAQLLAQVRAVRASPEFAQTVWDASRAQLQLLSVVAPELASARGPSLPQREPPARSQPAQRPPRSRSASLPASSTPPRDPSSGSFHLPGRRPSRGAVVRTALGAVTLCVIAYGAMRWVGSRGDAQAARSPAAGSPGGLAGSPSVDAPARSRTDPETRQAAIRSLVAAAAVVDLPRLIDRLERDVYRVSGGPRAKSTPAQAARTAEARSAALAILDAQPIARRFRELTGVRPFAAPSAAPPLLTDATLPLALRRTLYDALLLCSHLDDHLENRCGVGPAFGAQSVLEPWARVLESPGRDEADLARLCGARPDRSLLLHRNAGDVNLYAFSGITQAKDPDEVWVGPLRSDYTKREDAPMPQVSLDASYSTLELHALTEEVDRLRFFRLDFMPIGDAGTAATLILRPLHYANPYDSRILGLAVHRDLLPPGRYQLRIRAYRLTGVEQGGCRLRELRAVMR